MINYYNKISQTIAKYGYRGLILACKSKLLSITTEVAVNAPGISREIIVRTKTSDITTYEQVFIKLEYNFEIPIKPKVIIDCGANAGFASIYFSNKYPMAKIFAIEPELSNFALLRKNVSKYSNIYPTRAAVWKENIDIDIVDPGAGHWGYQTWKNNEMLPGVKIGTVPGITIDKFIKDRKLDYIDIMKIDIEGAEKDVFEDASKWIQKVGCIVIELHDWFKDGCSHNVIKATSDFDYKHKIGENNIFARRD